MATQKSSEQLYRSRNEIADTPQRLDEEGAGRRVIKVYQQ